MKKVLLFILTFMMIMSSVPVFAASDYITVVLDGNELDPKDVNGNTVHPIWVNGTTYLPIRAVATALNLSVEWDDTTKSVFINGTADAEKTDVVNIYINGVKFIPTDVNGNTVNPILKDGTTYLPIRAISEKFNKEVSWEQETHTVFLTTPTITEFEENKTYALINKASKNAISLTDSGLVLEPFGNYSHQGFHLTKADTDGYWYITASNDKNFDVNGNSKNPGAKIITYNKGTAENQQFKFEQTEDGYIIYALSSLLPIEDSVGVVKQNEKRDSLVQKWEIVEMVFSREKKDETTYYLMCLYKSGFLYDINDGIFFGEVEDGNPECDLWSFIPNEDGEYIITNEDTQKSLDVANRSTTSGDIVITYNTSGDDNQRWTLEKQEDGTYLIKSVHSGLYLSVKDYTLIQAELNESYKQDWILSPVKE